MGTLSVDKLMKTSTGAAEFTLPAADGTSGQAMITDGSGQLSLGNITIPDNAVTNAKMADDAVGLAELSATGTASATTFLRGDNSWASSSLAPAFSVCTNAVTAITAATNTKIVLDREVFDSNGAFASNRFTVPTGEAGKYFISGAILYLITGTIGSGGSNNQIQIHINGVESGTVSKAESNQSNTTSIAMVGSWCVDLAVADYVEMWGYISSSGTPTLQYNGNATIFRTHMMGFKLLGV